MLIHVSFQHVPFLDVVDFIEVSYVIRTNMVDGRKLDCYLLQSFSELLQPNQQSSPSELLPFRFNTPLKQSFRSFFATCMQAFQVEINLDR